MNMLEQLASEHDRVSSWPDGFRPSQFKLVRLVWTVTEWTEARNTEFCGHPGWVRFASDVKNTASIAAADSELLGMPLSAEWYDGKASFRLFPNAKQIGDTSCLKLSETSDVTSELFLREEASLMAKPGGRVTYAVYWTLGVEGGVDRFADGFLGFDGDRA